MKRLFVIIGCDTDPDRAGLLDGVPPDTLTWRGMAEGIPLLKEAVSTLTDSQGHRPVFTWLLRADEQIRFVHGEYAWVIREYRSLLEALEQSGDELGWHPHFWRLDGNAKRWYQDTIDVQWQVKMLESAHADYLDACPGRARSVRMGWDYHNNETLTTLARLGVVVDFSAIPGLKTVRNASLQHPENLFDWFSTPRRPYRPAANDYRRPAHGKEHAMPLWEAPNFVSTSLIWGIISGIQFARKMKDFGHLWRSLVRPTYWINITGRPVLFAPLLAELRHQLRKADDAPILFVSYFHPDELLPNRSGLYSLEACCQNLRSIISLAESESATATFVRASQISEILADY